MLQVLGENRGESRRAQHPVGGGQRFSEKVTRERNFEERVGVCQAESGGDSAGSRKQQAQRCERLVKGRLVKGHGRRWREKLGAAGADREGG